VSCATITFCVATDYAGNVLTSTHPTIKGSWKLAHIDATPLTDISCASVSLCVAVDGDGYAFTSTHPASRRAGWKQIAIDRAGIEPGAAANISLSVACPSTRLCLAVDQTGHVIFGEPRTAP
jgi:hypothetical protein